MGLLSFFHSLVHHISQLFFAINMRICFQKHFLILLPSLANLLYLTLSQPHINFYNCTQKEGKYTNKSTYQTNLNTLLSSLPSHIDDYGFGNYSFGQTPNTAYGLALCRGDLRIDYCRSCIHAVAVNLTQICPNYKEAVGWIGDCTLRYSSKPDYDKLDYDAFYCNYNYNNATDQDGFSKDLQSLLDGLRVRAASGGARRKFATGNVTGPDLVTILALMQCTPDLSQKECSDCLVLSMGKISTCSIGKVGGIIFWPSCTLRYETYPFYGDVPSIEDATPPPSLGPPKSLRTGEKSNNKTQKTILVLSSSIASIIVLILCICFFLKKWKLRKSRQKAETLDENESCLVDDINSVESMQYDFSTLCAATNNFSDSSKLGSGGFGAVYKGMLPNGQEIAVKRLSQNSHQGEVEFKNEVMLLAKLQHRNLVRLLGFCYTQTERLLIYEFMTNSSLDCFIFDPVKRTVLDWEKRYKIIGGVARGLLYLHEDSRLRIIHRDLKASNVLLDNDMNPKISDFGMARLFVMDETHGSTCRIVGTYGYMAPEYAMHGHFSVKSDVFSFGVLILEIVSGQKNRYFCKGEMGENLLSYTWNSWRQGRAFDLVDPSLASATNSTCEIIRCIHIGLLCVHENPVDRPTMAQVVLMLTSMSVTLPVPSQPAFFLKTEVNYEMPLLREYDSGTTDRSSDSRNKFVQSSDNEASITELYPR